MEQKFHMKNFYKGGLPSTTFRRESGAGFTIIELMVSMVIFLLVVGVVSTIFISFIKQQRQVLANTQLLNQISYAQEYMSKALRMAKKDTVGSCIPEGYIYLLTRADEFGFYRGIKFINQSAGNICQEFFLDNAVPGDSDTLLVLKELKNSANLDDAAPLTSEDLKIELVRFGVNGSNGCYGLGACPDGATQEDGVQPRVTILLGVKFFGDLERPTKLIQTTVSARDLNLP